MGIIEELHRHSDLIDIMLLVKDWHLPSFANLAEFTEKIIHHLLHSLYHLFHIRFSALLIVLTTKTFVRQIGYWVFLVTTANTLGLLKGPLFFQIGCRWRENITIYRVNVGIVNSNYTRIFHNRIHRPQTDFLVILDCVGAWLTPERSQDLPWHSRMIDSYWLHLTDTDDWGERSTESTATKIVRSDSQKKSLCQNHITLTLVVKPLDCWSRIKISLLRIRFKTSEAFIFESIT